MVSMLRNIIEDTVTTITIITIIMEKMKIKRKNDISLKSYAKINLSLQVLGKLEDNYHQIRTVFSEIDLFDVLNFTLTKKNEIKVLSNIVSLKQEDNLIYKIAVFIKEKYRVENGVIINLKKNIPIAAGLGGGSSNAAMTILALSEIFKLNLPDSALHSIADKFGSDINFFLDGGTALGFDRGQSMEFKKIKNILLINPGFGVSSKEAYQNVIESKNDWNNFKNTLDVRCAFNDLEKGVVNLYPEIGVIIRDCKRIGAINSILSGSGATVIGFFQDIYSVEKAKEFFKDKGYWVKITKTIRRTS